MAEFDQLATMLFEGDVTASDIKTMPGTGVKLTLDQKAKSLLDSMVRMGLVKNGRLLDPNK